MKKRFSKLLILSMTTVLTISMASANAFAEDDASEVSATYACEASIPNASDYGIPELNSDIVAGLKSMGISSMRITSMLTQQRAHTSSFMEVRYSSLNMMVIHTD